MTSYKLLNTENGETIVMSISDIIEDINRDRSDEWTPYDKTDWKEGLEEFTEYTLIGEVCQDCNGTGANESRDDKCPECKGRGQL